MIQHMQIVYAGLAWNYWFHHHTDILSENYLDSMLILANKALSFDNQLAEAYVIRGSYYGSHNKKEEAIKEYDMAIQLNPNSGQVYRNKADLYKGDDLVNRIDNLHKAIALERGPFLPHTYRYLGRSYAMAGFREKSIYYAKEAFKMDNDSALYYEGLTEAETFSGNFKQAIEFGEKSYSIDSNNRHILWLLGNQHMYLGQSEESFKYFKKIRWRLKYIWIRKYPAYLPYWICFLGKWI